MHSAVKERRRPALIGAQTQCRHRPAIGERFDKEHIAVPEKQSLAKKNRGKISSASPSCLHSPIGRAGNHPRRLAKVPP